MGEMESKLIELAIANGAFVLIVGIALFLIKSLVKYYIGLDTEKYKAELNGELEEAKTRLAQENLSFSHKLNQEMEAHKHQFELIKQKSQTEFSHLHAERANVIKELYLKLIELHAATHIFTRTIHGVFEDAEKEENERIERATTAFHDFKNFYLPNKLYFDKKTVAQLDVILSEFWTSADEFARTQNLFKQGLVNQVNYKAHIGQMNKISEKVAKEFPAMIEKIEDEFRAILGVR
jgi:hypothetical protein